MDSNYLLFSQHYYALEALRSDMDSKLSEYKVKTNFNADYSTLEKKLEFITNAQIYLYEIFDRYRIQENKNAKMLMLLQEKADEINLLKEKIQKLELEKEF